MQGATTDRDWCVSVFLPNCTLKCFFLFTLSHNLHRHYYFISYLHVLVFLTMMRHWGWLGVWSGEGRRRDGGRRVNGWWGSVSSPGESQAGDTPGGGHSPTLVARECPTASAPTAAAAASTATTRSTSTIQPAWVTQFKFFVTNFHYCNFYLHLYVSIYLFIQLSSHLHVLLPKAHPPPQIFIVLFISQLHNEQMCINMAVRLYFKALKTKQTK